uniref:Uncharacterized protein n=1 Tax=Chrysemys picta bellii TaxID=8478 RepID=A0A8C3H9L1_CHRPI
MPRMTGIAPSLLCADPILMHWPAKLAVDRYKTPQPIQIQLRCLRGAKDKVPKGRYTLKVSLLSRLGGSVLKWSELKEQQWAGMTLPISHDGNFYDVEICFDQSVYTVLPARKEVKPGMILLFELFLLHETNTYIDRVVGWGAFPLCDNNFNTLQGKFKCPFLRGHYDSKFDRFKKIENLISLDLDHWLCNLYFQIIKLPWYSDEQKTYETCLQLSPEFLAYSNITEKNGDSDKIKISGPQDDGFRSSCLHPGTHSKCSLASFQGWLAITFLAKLVSPRNLLISCHSTVEVRVSRRIIEHFHFGVYGVFSELGLVQWRSWDFWFIMLLVVLLWFVRLYLHYCSQWLVLQAISVPVAKFQLFPHTVELCYQNSLLLTREELAMVVVGPLTLNAVMLLMVLIRWGCQQLFDSFPSFLSKFIMAMGLWTVLDPLAVFVVDAFLGRLTYRAEKPIADAAKLYWLFSRTEQSGIPGALITMMLYTILFIISSTVLSLYFLSDEGTFFVPLDLEISNQELSYIMKKAEQWRGINGERRKVAVYDYIWKDNTSKSGVSSYDLQHQDEISECEAHSGEITVHVSIYTVHLSGFQDLYRQFLRLPDGAIVEVGPIGGTFMFQPSLPISGVRQHVVRGSKCFHFCKN